jgi:hypothetical protein
MINYGEYKCSIYTGVVDAGSSREKERIWEINESSSVPSRWKLQRIRA